MTDREFEKMNRTGMAKESTDKLNATEQLIKEREQELAAMQVELESKQQVRSKSRSYMRPKGKTEARPSFSKSSEK